MSGAKGKKGSGKSKTDEDTRERKNTTENIASMERVESTQEELTTAKAIQNLSKNIQELKCELKQELLDFKNDFRNDMKQEFNNFKTEMNQKLQNISGDVCNQDARLTEAEQRVEELETANTELRDSLLYSLKQQRTFQAKITDLEGHSRRNNIRIYGIKEGKEGPSMLTFINDFLKTKLMLDGSMDLQIQRAHRSLGPKHKDEAVSRSILVNFQRFDIKDKILKTAWTKKITYDGKMVMFAHDFPAEVNSRLKEYKDIRKILKEKQIRFQTPYPAKMKIYWDNGACVYNNATKAAEDMIKRGYPVDLPQTNVMDWEQKLTRGVHWNTEGDLAERVRGRLSEFQRQ